MSANLAALLDRAEAVITVKAKSAYTAIRREYAGVIEDSILDYFIGDGAVTSYRNAMQRAMSDAFLGAFELAYVEGGAELPLDDAAIEWLGARQDQELGYIRELFVSLKELKAQYRAGEIKTADIKAEMERRRDGYLATLDSVYTAGKMYAKQNEMLTWQYGDTEHCPTCLSLNGKAHRAKWYLARDYIPGKPGSAMDCGGYRCQCALIDKDGKEVGIA